MDGSGRWWAGAGVALALAAMPVCLPHLQLLGAGPEGWGLPLPATGVPGAARRVLAATDEPIEPGSREAAPIRSGLFAAGAPADTPVPSPDPTPPRRVVSLAPSLTEIVFALGAGHRLVGVTEQCDYPPQARSLPKIGSFLEPNVEAIVAARPDLVLAVPGPANRDEVEILQSLGVRVSVVDPEGATEVLDAIRRIALELGMAREGERLVRDLERRLTAVRRRTSALPRRRVVLLVDHDPLIVAGSGTYQDELIRLAGGENVAAAAGSGWPRLSLEALLAADPEVILDGRMGPGRKGERFWRSLRVLRAVREGRVYGPLPDHVLRPGPRIAESVEVLAQWIHPLHGLERRETGAEE